MFKKFAVIAATMVALGASAWAVWDFQPEQIEIVSPPRAVTNQGVNGLVKAADIPDVSLKAPFSQQAGFMSLPGHLRQLTYEHSGTWLTTEQALSVVKAQAEAASR